MFYQHGSSNCAQQICQPTNVFVFFFTARKWSWGKVMFSQLSEDPHVTITPGHETWLTPTPAPLLVTTSCYHWRPVQMCSLEPPGATPDGRRRVMVSANGRYASYGNAFLCSRSCLTSSNGARQSTNGFLFDVFLSYISPFFFVSHSV